MTRSDHRLCEYRKPLIFPRGKDGSPRKRELLELGAKAALKHELEADGFEFIAASFTVTWETEFQGYARAYGLRKDTKR